MPELAKWHKCRVPFAKVPGRSSPHRPCALGATADETPRDRTFSFFPQNPSFMASLSNCSTKTLTVSSSSFFLDSWQFLSDLAPPLSVGLLAAGADLPPVPSDFPHTKIIPNTRFVVDGFRSAGDFSVSYFLSHFHSDHYAGLGPGWFKGVVFCSELTAALLVEVLKVPALFVVSLALGKKVEIDGCEVTAVDANHCPGAVQFLFVVPGSDGRGSARFVHTGDFRYCESMKSDPILCQFVGADAVFLDITYCNPKYVFPSHEESIEYVVKTIEKIRAENKGSLESVLFLIATYVVGKERILLEISRRCGCSLHVDDRKMQIMSILGFGQSGVFTKDISVTNIHVIGRDLLGETWPYFRPKFVKMKELMIERGYSKAVGFVSTGWMYETKRDGFAVRAKESLEIHLVPYSEHSGYDELRDYMKFLRPNCVVPTVGVDTEKLDGKQSVALQKHFRDLVDETAYKHEFLMAFHRKEGNDGVRAGDDVPISGTECENVEETGNLHFEIEPTTKESNLQYLKKPNNECIEAGIEELRECLPSWVTHQQILGLLRSSGGDIVEAVSDFFEHERELYKQVKDGNLTVLSSQTSSVDDFPSHPNMKLSQETSDSVVENILPCDKKPTTVKISVFKNPSSQRKRSSGTEKKSKKKGRSTLGNVESKQPTITKFFGRAVSSSLHIDGPAADVIAEAVTTSQQIKIQNQFLDNGSEMYKKELDQNDAIPKHSAVHFLEKADSTIV